MDYNSVKNQRIKSKFVEREVFACVSGMVDYIIKKGWEDTDAYFSWDDIENGYSYTCPECGHETGNREDFDDGTTDDFYPAYKCPECGTGLEDYPESETQEIYEWWICSSWLIDKLAECGEPVLRDESIWGRGTSGQAILLDGVISRICEGMEILEGQAHEWKID